MFYAPWCGHCKRLKPEFDSAAATLKREDVNGILAAVDVTKHRSVGERYGVTGYPTLKYFVRGELKYDAGDVPNVRKADGIVEFMRDPKEPPPPPPPEKPWSETEGHVVHLTDESFKGFLKKKKHVLVMFYAPCKKS
jgi:protein disulfide-isomerase-like protein